MSMHKNLFFDYSALVIIVLLTATTILRRMVKGKVNRNFIHMLLVAGLTIVFDIASVLCDGASCPDSIKYLFNTCYLMVHSVVMLFFIAYLVSLTDTWHIYYKHKLLTAALMMPAAVSVIMIIINLFTHSVFYINENGYYTRGAQIPILYIAVLLYVLYVLVYVAYFRKAFRTRYIISIELVFMVVVVSSLFQFVYADLLVEMFCMSIGLLFLSLMVQRPEERLDVVTGLSRLTAYMEDMGRSFRNQKPMQIIMMNIKNFDAIQSQLGYGRMMGFLKQIANILLTVNREQGLNAELYYLEGGKFRFVMDEPKFSKVIPTADKINSVMKENFVVNQMSVDLPIIICIAKCPEDIADLDSLMTFGDMLNTVPFHGKTLFASELFDDMNYDLMRHMSQVIERGIRQHHFEVYYQPIYSVKEGKFHSAEALIRLKDDQYGFVSPELFIPEAEKNGAIHQIGDFVLEEVCKFIASPAFQRLGLSFIEVNLSMVQCMQPKLTEHITGILKKYDVKPAQINLEITETAAAISQKTLETNIKELTSAGIQFSMDDFGTGYSNMQRVVQLPFNIIKLDRTFTQLYDDRKHEIFLSNMIRMIKALDMKIVVEGVETEDMLKLFSDLDCDYIQGFYFSKPIPQKEFEAFIQEALEG